MFSTKQCTQEVQFNLTHTGCSLFLIKQNSQQASAVAEAAEAIQSSTEL